MKFIFRVEDDAGNEVVGPQKIEIDIDDFRARPLVTVEKFFIDRGWSRERIDARRIREGAEAAFLMAARHVAEAFAAQVERATANDTAAQS